MLLAGLGSSWALARAVERQQQHHLSTAMDQRAQAVGGAVTAEINRYSDTILDLAVAVGAQSDLTAADFATLTSRLSRDRLPGVSSAAFVVAASDAQIPEVQARWRAAGNSALTLAPFGTGTEHFFPVLTHSLDGVSARDGRDVSQAKEPTQALLEARSRIQVAASPTYVLLMDRSLPIDEQQLSFVLTAPVYGGEGTPDAGRFQGWILMGLRGTDFITTTMRTASQQTVAVRLFDVSTSGAPVVAVAHYTEGRTITDPRMARTVVVPVAGREWQLLVQPTAGISVLTGPSLTRIATGAGILFTLLLTLLLTVLLTSRNRALARVDRATATLRSDIERRELLETELRGREEELQAFAGIVAHDLKAPLMSLAGYGKILADEYAPALDGQAVGYVDRILHNVRRMQILITDLLAYAAARDAQLDYQPVDLNALVQDIITERLHGLDEVPHIETAMLPMVDGDPVLLRQLLDNLIGNSLKYVSPGVLPHISVNYETQATGWRITVADRGIGISADEQHAVFESFHRARASAGYTGTGLGLAICRRITKRHGGDIGVCPNPGGGSLFWFTLPTGVRLPVAPDDRVTGEKHLVGGSASWPPR
jgi:signal transduction histidine kinase